ncbi:MAG: extracellular solute-binding protein [Zetaproteobacteria bacterium]|nr:extracellular solute-binding protein [Zetaproteobacteria bacterium]
MRPLLKLLMRSWLMCLVVPMVSAQVPIVSILSSHRKAIQREYIYQFERQYGIKVKWLDLGGTENSLRYLKTKIGQNKPSIGIDIFWGGGDLVFDELERLGGLSPIVLPPAQEKALPKSVLGAAMKSEYGGWRASSISGFGIFWNRALQKRWRLTEPQDWSDLAQSEYAGRLSLADPRHSSSALVVYLIVLLRHGWERGWQDLLQIAANASRFTHSSLHPVQGVVAGDVAAAMTIDFYATAKIHTLGNQSFGFVTPEQGRVFTVDPIGLLKGAPHLDEAQKFISFVLSHQGQGLYTLPKGHSKGPKWNTLNRMSIHPGAYQECDVPGVICAQNPFELSQQKSGFPFEQARLIKLVASDIIGSLFIDLKAELNAAWVQLRSLPARHPARIRFVQPILSYAEVVEASKQWSNPGFRLRKLNLWMGRASDHFKLSSTMKNLALK